MKNVVFLIGVLMISSGVLAGISISEPESLYNLGDRLYIDLGGIRGSDSGNLDINLVCRNTSVNLVRIPARAFASDEDQTYSVPYKILSWEDLGIFDLGGIVGTCQVVVSLGGDVSSGKSFEVSNDIVVNGVLDKTTYNPGELVSVSVSAVKANGKSVNGFVDGSNASSFNLEVVDGVAETSFSVSETAEAGVYYLGLRAYDVGNAGVLNEGTGFVSYAVNQVPTSLVLSLSDLEVVPGNNFSIGVDVFDQSGVSMPGNVFVKIVSPEGDEVENVVGTGDFVSMDLESNSSVGTWKIVGVFDDLMVERGVEVLPLQKVEFDFEEAVLVVKNVGNVLYNKSIEVEIGEEIMTLELRIGVGEVRKFSLEAPVGSYDVVVGDGEYEVTRKVLLTGNAIRVSDFKGSGIFRDYSIIWIFLIIVLGGIGVVLFMRFRKTRTVGKKSGFFAKLFGKIKGHRKTRKLRETGDNLKKKVSESVPASIKSRMDESLNFTNKSPAVQGLDSSNYTHEDKTMVDYTRKGISSAESALVLKGEKHVSGVLALSVKNSGSLSDVAKEGLREIVENSKGKGLVDYRGDYIFILFSPLATRTYSNERLAVQCAARLKENLLGYNKKFRDKVEFGIGVHFGDLVASKVAGKLKYTGIGNTISFAKRMSDVDSYKIVVSDDLRKKLIRELKVSKGKEIGEKKTYVVSEIKDRSGDAERLKQLMARRV